MRIVPLLFAIGGFIVARANKWPWWSSLILLLLALWYFVSAVQGRALLDKYTTNELDLEPMIVAPSPVPADSDNARVFFNPPTNCFDVMFLIINNSPRQVTLRSQLVLHSVRGVNGEYPQASVYMRWPFPDLGVERTIKPGRDGRIDVATVAADARQIRFLGPSSVSYMTLDIEEDATEITGQIDSDAMDRDADVCRVRFTILVNRADPVRLMVEEVRA